MQYQKLGMAEAGEVWFQHYLRLFCKAEKMLVLMPERHLFTCALIHALTYHSAVPYPGLCCHAPCYTCTIHAAHAHIGVEVGEIFMHSAAEVKHLHSGKGNRNE